MFNRSRKKIILSIMGSLILLFTITLTVILFASYREIRQQNTEMLERYVELYALELLTDDRNVPDAKPDGGNVSDPEPDGRNAPGAGPNGLNEPGTGPKRGEPPPDEKPGYQLSTFYSVALAEDGSVLAVDNGLHEVYEADELVGIAEKLLSEGKTSGRTDNLSYIVSRRPDYTLVAFMDNTVTESSLSLLLHNVLMIGGLAIVVIFFISLQLSRQIIHPLEENDRQQKQFISDASHELKTPVAVISANAELLSRELGENEWLENIQYENDRMGGLVKQLLDLSRAENAETLMETINFSRVVTGEVLAFESLAFEQGKTIRSQVDDEICLAGNQSQLTQLVSVLLDNAIRHSTGSEIEISLKRQAHMAVLDVINDGDEIPPEKQEHLFDRFYRVDEARNSEGQHYGLGLSIAKAVAEKHGGTISLSCRDGKVRFTVSIPVKK